MLTLAADGEAKLWPAAGGAVCCTLLPEPACRTADSCLLCRPVATADGRFVLCGAGGGELAAYDLWQLQAQAQVRPLNPKHSNAAMTCQTAHTSRVSAVGLSPCGRVLVSGDSSGQLCVRWL